MITIESLNGKFTCYENDWITKEMQTYGTFSRSELSMIIQFLKLGDTVLDIGAHIGTFSVPIKRVVGANGKLFSFEANPETFALLKRNLADNNIEATALNKGVSAKKGTLYLKGRKLKDRNKTNDNNEPLNSGADYLTDNASEDLSDLIKVELVKIDDIVSEPVHFIKADVEGMELSVFQSAVNVIDKHRPIVYSEYFEPYIKRANENPKNFEHFFKSRRYDFFINIKPRAATNDDFKLVRIPNPKYIRGQVDFLLIPRESARYPAQYLNWYRAAPLKFLLNRLQNFLKDINSILKSLLVNNR